MDLLAQLRMTGSRSRMSALDLVAIVAALSMGIASLASAASFGVTTWGLNPPGLRAWIP